MRTKRIVALALAGCMAVSMLTACGNNSSSTTNSNSTATTTETAVPADAGLHNLSDGVLDIGTTIKWDSMTPFRSTVANNAPWAYQVYETLATLSYDKVYEPLVAKSWSLQDDGVTYDMEIYDYVTDSAGNHITADDIVWMLQACVDAGLKTCYDKIDTITKTGDYTLQVKLKQNVVGAFETILTSTYVVSKAAYEADGNDFATQIVSTAPYIVTEFTAGSTMTIEKRDDYWQKPELIPAGNAANVDKITYHVITEASQAGIALETGELDGFMSLDPNTATQFVGNSTFSMIDTPYINGYQMFFSGDPSRTITDDVNLRQAICYAIDVDGLITGVFAGYGSKMHDSAANTAMGYLEKWEDEEYYPYDPEKAKELLAQSNYNGEELVLLAGSNSTSQRLTQMIQGYLAQVGITVKLNLADQALLTSIRLDGSQYDMFINTVGGDWLSDHWATRYDMNAYATGDACARHDEVLADMLYSTWTEDGFTEENIDAVHNYIKDNMYGFGMVQPNNIDIWRSDIGLTEIVRTSKGGINWAASVYSE